MALHFTNPISISSAFLHILDTKLRRKEDAMNSLRRTAVDGYDLAINPFRLLAGQEANNARDIHRVAVPS